MNKDEDWTTAIRNGTSTPPDTNKPPKSIITALHAGNPDDHNTDCLYVAQSTGSVLRIRLGTEYQTKFTNGAFGALNRQENNEKGNEFSYPRPSQQQPS